MPDMRCELIMLDRDTCGLPGDQCPYCSRPHYFCPQCLPEHNKIHQPKPTPEQKKVKVDGKSADAIVYEAFFMTWDEPLCKDPECKCTNSVRWRAARAIEAVQEALAQKR